MKRVSLHGLCLGSLIAGLVIAGCGSDKSQTTTWDGGLLDGNPSDSDISFPDADLGAGLALVPCQWRDSLLTVEDNDAVGVPGLRQDDHTVSVLYPTKRQSDTVILERAFNEEGNLESETTLQDGFFNLDQPNLVRGADGKEAFVFIGNYQGSHRLYVRVHDGSAWADPVVFAEDSGPALRVELVALEKSGYAVAWSTQVTSPTVQSPKLHFARLDANTDLVWGPSEVVFDGTLNGFTLAKGGGSALVFSTIENDSSHHIFVRPIKSTGALDSVSTEVLRDSADPVTDRLAAVRTTTTSTLVGWTELAGGTTPIARVRNIYDGSDVPDPLKLLAPSAKRSSNVAMASVKSFSIVAFQKETQEGRWLSLQVHFPYGEAMAPSADLAIEASAELGSLQLARSEDYLQVAVAFRDAGDGNPRIRAATGWCVE